MPTTTGMSSTTGMSTSTTMPRTTGMSTSTTVPRRPGRATVRGAELGSPAPWSLLALAPAFRRLVAVPRAALFVVQLHRDAVRGTPALGPCRRVGGLHRQRKALEHRIEPGQQAPLVTVAQGQLHLTATKFEVHVHRRWRFRERRRRIMQHGGGLWLWFAHQLTGATVQPFGQSG
jgi:hypothetical protein